MTASQAIEYIHSVSWMGSRPGLDRTRELLGLMGNPQDKLRFVHVAGTNGKGSTCAMLASILQASGLKVGLYTSPYILRFNERMRVNNEDISDLDLAAVTEYVKPFAESMKDHPTEFELVTAIGFEYFYRQNCDIVVLEVGLGGQLDSTNVIKAPLLTLITEIDYDHMGVLGDSIEQIAAAKAGIIKKGSTVISADNIPAAALVISEACQRESCAHISPDYENITDKTHKATGISFKYKGEEYSVPLLGDYQFRNALMAIKAAEALGVATEAIKQGLAKVAWRGRFEQLCADPMFFYDGGHNPQGVRSAVESYKARFGKERCVVLFGVMADKDYKEEIQTLLSVAAEFVTVTPGNPRALSATALSADIHALGGKATPAATVEKGVVTAAKIAGGKCPVLAVGSLYMYGEIYGAIKKEFLQK